MITEDFVSPELAKLLKDKGFDGGCFSYYYEDNRRAMTHVSWQINNSWFQADHAVTVPTLQMAMKWLREVHHIFLSIQQHMDMSYVWYVYVDGDYKDCDRESHNNTYEQACEAAIKYCLENLI